MKIMTLTIKTKNKKKIATTKSFLKAINVKYKEKVEKPYNPEFVAKILQGDKDFENGKCVRISLENLWK